MPLQPLEFAPGVSREGTQYSDTGRWFVSQLVRFRRNGVEKMGGWIKYTSQVFQGYARALRRFSVNSGEAYTGIGTSTKVYIEVGGTLTDITPIRDSVLNLTNPITTISGSAIVTVADTAHGSLVGDTIIVAQATDTGGILAAQINIEAVILTVPTADSFTYTTNGTASSSVTGGGAGVDITYLVNPGSEGGGGGAGWGAGVWARSTWGSAIDLSVLVGGGYLTQWSLEPYGEDLIVVPRFGAPYYWDASSATARVVLFSTLGGASNTPTKVIRMLVSPRSRHTVAFGVNQLGQSAIDRMLVRWSDNEDIANWTPSTIVTAGDQRLTRGSTIITAVPTKNQMLIFTDTSLYSMTWIGGEFVFSLDLASEKINIAGFSAATVMNDVVYWIGRNGFYRYAGEVLSIFCDLHDYILQDINWNFAEKIHAATNIGFHEVIWFYVSNDSSNGEPDKYVIYNNQYNIWYYGALSRTAWTDVTFTPYPFAASTDGYIYSHELGTDDGSTASPTAINAYIESAPFELGNGDSYAFVSRVIHDVTFRDGESGVQQMNLILKTSDYPGEDITDTTTTAVERSATMPVEQYTKQSFIRLRGRQFKLRAESNSLGSMWRLGRPRIEVRTDGRR